MIEQIKSKFESLFTSQPTLLSSPGRVNLIGEHTDYNEGFVLPASINKAIHFAFAPNTDGMFRFYAFDLNEEFSTPTDKIEPSEIHWANYLLGVIKQFTKDGKSITGLDCVFGGNVPLGAGMSSSAAIENGIAVAINHLYKFNYSSIELTKFAQKAEHEYAGVQCGIMDQFAIMHGKQNQVIKLDCRSLDYELFPLDMKDHLLVLVNTGVKHSLASSEYNKRRQECEAGVSLMKKHKPEINSLRDISEEEIKAHETEFDAIVFKRCLYVIQENSRLQNACQALLNGNIEHFGEFMYGSHYGLKDLYEVSCAELDQLVEIAKQTDGVVGARMMGGGFGGCTINLVERTKVAAFKTSIIANYKTPDGEKPEIYEVQIEEGTHIVN